MATVNFVTADSWGPNLTGATFTTFFPSDCQAGDMILAMIFTDGAVTAAPSGWTLINQITANDGTPPDGTAIWVYKFTGTLSSALNDTESGAWTRNNVGQVCIAMFQARCSDGSAVVVEGYNNKYQVNTGYSIGMAALASTVEGSMFVACAMSRIYDNVTLPDTASQPAQYAMCSDLTRAENGRHEWGYAQIPAGTEVATFDNFTLNPGSSTTNTMASFVVLLSPTGGGGSGVTIEAVSADTFRCNDLIGNAARVRLALTDGTGMSDSITSFLAKVITETLRIQEVLSPNAKFGVISTETIQLASRLLAGRNLALTEGIGIHEIAQALYTARMVETLGLQSLLTPHMSYGMSIIDRIRIQDALRRFFAADVAEGLGLAEALAEKIVLNGRLIDAVGITPDLTQHVLMRMTVSDEIVLDDVELLNMIFAGRLSDGIQISALHVEPNGSITTWAINTKSGTVTEYGNYAFNSFAAMGGRYLGASDTGLYALDGDDDSGTPIIAHLKGGFMQFGNMHMSSIKGVYLGIRGAGDFVLKIETGDKKVYVYALKARDFETTRVRPGKGLRARFFRFELISTGQDFDLEAVEFIPVVAQRRG